MIDVVINGHTHRTYTNTKTRSSNIDLPIIQAGANGDYLGRITLEVNTTKNKVISSKMTNLNVRNIASDYEVNQIVSDYIKEEANKVAPIVNDVLGTAGRALSSVDILKWSADVIKEATSADKAFINSGAFRSGTAINKDSKITYGILFEMMPFDNVIKTSRIKGSYLQSFYDMTEDGMVYDSNFKGIDANKTYLIATVDYVFDKTYNPFTYYGQDNQNTQMFIRDLLSEDIKSYTNNGLKFNP